MLIDGSSVIPDSIGNPVLYLLRLDSRLRGNDRNEKHIIHQTHLIRRRKRYRVAPDSICRFLLRDNGGGIAMSADLFELRKGLEAAVAKIIKNIEKVDRYLASGQGDFHHPHELRAMLIGVKKISEFVLDRNMDIQAVKTPEGQLIAREALRAHRCYEPLAFPEERKAYDFDDTVFFLMWLLELPPHCQDT